MDTTSPAVLVGRRPPTDPPLTAGEWFGRWPLSHEQHRVWRLERGGHGGAALRVSLVLRLRGPLDVSALAGALDDVVARQAALRTRFGADGAVPWQRPADAFPIRPTAPGRWLTAPFDLEHEPPWRVALAGIDGGEHELTFVFHRIVFDDWSERVLLDELGRGVRGPPAGPGA